MMPHDQLKPPTRRAVAENRTIPLVFALLRPHCCVVTTLYAAPLQSQPMTDYQVLHTGSAHSARRPIGAEPEP